MTDNDWNKSVLLQSSLEQNRSLPPLKGLLRLLQNHYKDPLKVYPYNHKILEDSQQTLQSSHRQQRRRRRRQQEQQRRQDYRQSLQQNCDDNDNHRDIHHIDHRNDNKGGNEGHCTLTATAMASTKGVPEYIEFADAVRQHTLSCFFFVQEPYTPHTLLLRQLLGHYYYNSMTLFFVSLSDQEEVTSSFATTKFDSSCGLVGGNGSSPPCVMDSESMACCDAPDYSASSRLFWQGAGCIRLPPTPILQTLLQVTQIPTIAIINTSTGRPIASNAELAIAWNTITTTTTSTTSDDTKNQCNFQNDPHGASYLVSEWEKGNSGLSMSQALLAMTTLQGSSCLIL